MDCSTSLPYATTGFYNNIVTDYVAGNAPLRDFYEHPVSEEGFRAAIRARQAYPTDRQTLVKVLEEQYRNVSTSPGVQANIAKLADENTFTIITAHQPNIFTGYLYFIYKIIHAIRLAEHYRSAIPEFHFVPVFYMGNEDADLDELGKIWLNGEKLVWDTKQKGAVGRMKTTGLDNLIHRIDGELSVLPHGKELMHILRESYLASPDVQTATFKLVNTLFASYGLVVIIPDHPLLKAKMAGVFEEDLFRHVPSQVVAETISRLSADGYKVQANPREINTFYLKGDIRNRIERQGDRFIVVDTDISFSDTEMRSEISVNPERFSPNVILRGLYQEMILPNIAFIGGGGELAYWLELRDLFRYYQVPYPVQVLRNSFLLLEPQWQERLDKLGLSVEDIFQPERGLLDTIVMRDTTAQVHLTNELRDTRAFYEHLRTIGGKVDKTLEIHINALEARMVRQLENLERKLLRAEKRKFTDESRQVQALKQALFPNDGLQERVDNFLTWYAKYGRDFLQMIYDNSLLLEQQFIVCKLVKEKISSGQLSKPLG